jgi:hypothetical protein
MRDDAASVVPAAEPLSLARSILERIASISST